MSRARPRPATALTAASLAVRPISRPGAQRPSPVARRRRPGQQRVTQGREGPGFTIVLRLRSRLRPGNSREAFQTSHPKVRRLPRVLRRSGPPDPRWRPRRAHSTQDSCRSSSGRREFVKVQGFRLASSPQEKGVLERDPVEWRLLQGRELRKAELIYWRKGHAVNRYHLGACQDLRWEADRQLCEATGVNRTGAIRMGFEKTIDPPFAIEGAPRGTER